MDQDNQGQQPVTGSVPENNAQPAPGSSSPAGSDPSAPIAPTPPEKPAGGNKKMLIIVGAVAALLVIGGVLAFAMQGKKTDEHSDADQHSSSSTSDSNSSASDSSATSSTTPQSGEVNVDIKDFAFSPEKVTVKKGTKVTWTNQDTVAHTVTSDSDSAQKGLDSGNLAKGKSYSFTFDTVGQYNYHCVPHPNMIGLVEVVE